VTYDWKARLTPEQVEKIYQTYRRWLTTLPPCGIEHFHPYNPCLAEDWEGDGKLRCLTCGLRQVLEVESSSSKPGSSNGRATLLQSVDKGSIPLSGTAGEAGWHYASGCDPVWLTPIAGSNPVARPGPGYRTVNYPVMGTT
jgi:hypothetical protein